VNRRPSLAEALGYLADIGYEEVVRRRKPAGPPQSAAPEAAPGPPVVTRGQSSDERVEALFERLSREVTDCRRCRLCEGRRRAVFGDGDPRADLMFIGEGPGAEEDRQGLPFVGRAGDLLNRIIAAIELERSEVYIANIVKCRPPGNRDPQADEVAACRGYLEAQIDAIRPRVLVALGRVAAQTLLGNNTPIGKMRGQWFEVRGVPTMVTYHPAALLRSSKLKRPTWEDMQQVRDRLRAGQGTSAADQERR
jgi:uracil-DNA glycosylase